MKCLPSRFYKMRERRKYREIQRFQCLGSSCLLELRNTTIMPRVSSGGESTDTVKIVTPPMQFVPQKTYESLVNFG